MTSDRPALTRDAPGNLLARHPLTSFFVMAFAFAWIVETPLILSETGTGILPYTLPKTVMALSVVGAIYAGPTVAAFVLTGVTEGRPGIRRLLKRYLLWRVPLRWYAFVLLCIPWPRWSGQWSCPVRPRPTNH